MKHIPQDPESLFQEPFTNDRGVRCLLCPHRCLIPPGMKGLCRSRENRGGRLVSSSYGHVAALHVDPIEKKPLYHFLPGSRVLSAGNNGCNLKCAFCQNWSISQIDAETTYISPADLLQATLNAGTPSVAFTYAEPVVWFDYVLDCCRMLRESGIKTALVTNGMINPEPLAMILPFVDAMNIDIKSMDSDFYRSICHGWRDPVLETARMASHHCHLEITNLVIPNRNDSEELFHRLGVFIQNELSSHTPLHLSAYHPEYRLSEPPTSYETLKTARMILRQYLDFVYLGNISPSESDTICPSCGTPAVQRSGYRNIQIDLSPDGHCLNCSQDLHVILK